MATLRAKKEDLLKEVYLIMTAVLGTPPLPVNGAQDTKFVWEYYNKDGKSGRWEGTPKQFYAIAKGDYSVSCPFVTSLTRSFEHVKASGLVLSHQRPTKRIREALHC